MVTTSYKVIVPVKRYGMFSLAKSVVLTSDRYAFYCQ